jgi:hypothetical protein
LRIHPYAVCELQEWYIGDGEGVVGATGIHVPVVGFTEKTIFALFASPDISEVTFAILSAGTVKVIIAVSAFAPCFNWYFENCVGPCAIV